MKKQILIVDDEKSIQAVLQRALATPSLSISSAFNGEEAISSVQARKPDLILLDIRMPGKDGREVLKELRGNIETRMIPIIILTGKGELMDKIMGFELGADDYITKPFEIKEIKARLESILRRNNRDISANPLTRLPGSPSIEEEVYHRIREAIPFAFLYVDIDQFKAFNDAYGYARGDQVIRKTAEIILKALKYRGNPGDFVGHIGGDDFVVISQPSKGEKIAEDITTHFDNTIPEFYSLEDRTRGYILTRNRLGQEQRFPLMTVTVSITSTEVRCLNHYAKVVDIAARIKRYAKLRKGNHGSLYMVDRRNDFKESLCQRPMEARLR